MAKTTLIAQDKEALGYIKQAVDIAYKAVKVTFGPNAKKTLMYRTYNRGPRFVDDGYWTLESIIPKNPFVKLVYEAFKEATKRTNERVGDGTTGTTIFAAELFNNVYAKLQAKVQGYSASSSKKNPQNGIQLQREILDAAKDIKDKIRAASKPIKTLADLERISAISLGEENEISKTVANMAWEVGVDGYLDTVEGYKGEIETELIKGMRFPAKTCGKAFVNQPQRYEMVVENCPVFITNHKLDNDLLTRFVISKFEETKVIIIAPDFSDQVLVNMVLARENGTFIWPVKAPSLRTEQMEDLAVYCGATLMDKDKGHKLQTVTKEHLGLLEKLIVKDAETREDAVALGGKGSKTEAVKERIKTLEGQLKETKQEQFKHLMRRRIASMASAVGVIRVGAATDAESLPLKLKIEDVVNACRAALKSGYVKGGGMCLKEIADDLPEGHIMKSALLAPYEQIQRSAGGSLKIDKDVIDPTDAVYYAVEHGASVVASLITTETLVTEEPELQTGEGEMAIAKAINGYVSAWKREKGIMTENEKMMEADAKSGLTDDEMLALDQG